MEENKTVGEDEREQEIWSWGAGTEGQLGTGRLQDEHTPQLLHSFSSFAPISSLSCGGAHVIALTPDGRVLTWGRGTSGQLGHGEMVNSLQPKPVKAVEGLVISHASAGWNHSGFVSDTGLLFTCGDGSFGQLGHGDYKSQCTPIKVSCFSSKHVEQIACGMRHSLVLLRDPLGDQVYGFGSGKRGQLGISNDKVKSASLPRITLGLTEVNIKSINANGDHSAALSAGGHLYTWGRGFRGASDLYFPHCFPSDLSFKQVVLGWNHALVQTSEHKVFMIGGYHHGVLGDPQKTALMKHTSAESKEGIMQRIPNLEENEVLHIAAGAEHSALVTGNGSVMTWGWGEHGQLGLGDTVDQTDPQVVSLGHNLTEERAISRVYCGSGFSFVLRTYDGHSQIR
ncbi:Regulator of chromosome condensation (RCC1) family protein [Abeliophyllum distichum]|uniref:Regulator of chromosome condensation (RCC1) family protein n=1 Tax=Abeliophyllum distichum TaxID=126358 RepID=A0ABD1U365_9LAMI